MFLVDYRLCMSVHAAAVVLSTGQSGAIASRCLVEYKLHISAHTCCCCSIRGAIVGRHIAEYKLYIFVHTAVFVLPDSRGQSINRNSHTRRKNNRQHIDFVFLFRRSASASLSISCNMHIGTIAQMLTELLNSPVDSKATCCKR